jgi:hypothetical protein
MPTWYGHGYPVRSKHFVLSMKRSENFVQAAPGSGDAMVDLLLLSIKFSITIGSIFFRSPRGKKHFSVHDPARSEASRSQFIHCAYVQWRHLIDRVAVD